MIAAVPHGSKNHKEAHVQGWLVSILLHGTVALAAILLVEQVQLAPQDEAFKWNVAMVAPTQPVQSTVSARSQTPAQSVPSTTSAPLVPRRRLCQHRRSRHPSLLRNRQLHRSLREPAPRW